MVKCGKGGICDMFLTIIYLNYCLFSQDFQTEKYFFEVLQKIKFYRLQGA